MFDAESEAFLRSVAPLPGLDAETLPERFTEHYAQLAAARMRGDSTDQEQSDSDSAWRLTALADAYEILVTTAQDPQIIRPAAFVAATAQQLLAQAPRNQDIPTLPSSLTRDDVSPEIAAPLMFLIAEQFADASDAAARIRLPSSSNDPLRRQLFRALRALARGRVSFAYRLPLPEFSHDTALSSRAEQVLIETLFKATQAIAGSLLGIPGDSPLELLERVIDWTIGPETGGQPVSSFPGYGHLAVLLRQAFRALDGHALVQLDVPPSVDPEAWSRWIRRRARVAPFIWPNHLAPVRSGFHLPGTSTVLVLPTGAGKTTLASLKIATTVTRNLGVVMLAPTHALVEQLTAEFEKTFPDNFDLISVMTPEHCLALLSFQPQAFDEVGLIVFDEAHLLSMESGTRRSIDAMLAVLLLTQRIPHADMLFLSAMLRNGLELAAWVEQLTGRPCTFFDPLWKPSRQARGVVMYRQSELQAALDAASAAQRQEDERVGRRATTVRAPAKQHLHLTPWAMFGLENNWLNESTADVTMQRLIDDQVAFEGKLEGSAMRILPTVNRVAHALAHAAATSGLKSIVFANVKSHTISVARDLRESLAQDVSNPESDQDLWNDLAVELGGLQFALNAPGASVVAHNGLMLRVERLLAERSFRRKDGAAVIVATPTLAQGMNLPADVAILASEKRAGVQRGREPLAAHELMNAAARAGRAGHVANGLVILISEEILTFEPDAAIGPLLVDRLKAILPSDDRSVDLTDPLQEILDRLSSGRTEDPDVEYVLNRLRLEDEPDSLLSIGLSERSFAGFQARRAGIDATFRQQIEQLQAHLESRASNAPLDDHLRVVAAQTGLGAELLLGLRARLDASPTLPTTISEWVTWTFRWLGSDDRIVRGVFGNETGALSQSIGRPLTHDLAASDMTHLEAGVQAWISGAPISSIELILGGEIESESAICPRARTFVTKAIPLAIVFATSVVARVAQGLERSDEPGMSLVLDALPMGVRDGFDRPSMIALAQVEGRRSLRVAKHISFAAQTGIEELEQAASSIDELQALVRDRLTELG